MANTSENNASFYDILSKSQKQLFEQWAKSLETFEVFVNTRESARKMSENSEQAAKLYEAWTESAGKYLDVMMRAFPANTGSDTFLKLFRASDAYAQLYDFWEPLATAIQEQALDADAFKDLLDPAQYRETIDKIFGFGSPDAVSDVYAHATDIIETWGTKGQRFLQPWSDAMRHSIDASLAAASGDADAGVEVLRSLHSAFEQTFGKALNMPAVGKDREQVELVSKAIDRYSDFLAKNAELQRQMHTIAHQAMKKVIESMAQRMREGEPIKGFGEFVQLWTTTNEQAFLEFFRTDEFSQLQGIVLDTALDCRRQFQQLMEACLKDFPIALRSEMDDICRTTYTLNKTVRALGKKSTEIDAMRSEIKHLKKKVATLEKKLSATESSEN